MKIELTMKQGETVVSFVSESSNEKRVLALLHGKEGQLVGISAQGQTCREGYVENDLHMLQLIVAGGL